QVLEPEKREKIKQGVVTEVVGNCGFAPFPYSGDASELRSFGSGILGRTDAWGWQTANAYLDSVSAKATIGVASLAGHGSLRIAVAGPRQGPLSAAELDRLCGLLEDSLDAGCAGFSTGLMYAPGGSATRAELVRLCSIVARKGKLYATHMRSYAAGLIDAVREQLDLALASGCRLQISHLQAAGRGNWGLQQRALDEIETVRRSGVDVEFDIYPYQCGSTVLTQWLPQWALDGGTEALLTRLADAPTRAKILIEMDESPRNLWSDITISAVGSDKNAYRVGATLESAADALDLLADERAAVNVISFNQSEDNLRQLLTHPLCSIISDGFYVKGKPHPRLHGTFPELLGNIVRERKWMTLTEAIHKITARPAARLGRTCRLTPGATADVTVFDPASIASRATYESPQQDPVGIRYVIREGRVIHEGNE
ncbi:MAG TPA: amidohydrolase family protein, partial [Bryobacteraceae bacterium]